MNNIDSSSHVTGKSVYLDDIPVVRGTLYCVVVTSPVANGKIRGIESASAAAIPGVERVISFKDIPGRNQIGGIIEDEPLFAEHEVDYCGQPVLLIVASDKAIARKAGKLIKLDIEEEAAVTDPRVAKERGMLLMPPRTFRTGDTESAWAGCAHIFEGRSETGGQEHLYLETQGAYAFPVKGNGIKVFSSTQGPAAVQKTIAKVLGIPMNRIEVDVERLGGAFGGKEDQASGFAAMAALATFLTGKPVKLVPERWEDILMTGKRHPYSSDFKIGLSDDYSIIAYKATLCQNGGAAADLSPAIMERTLLHSTNAYFIPNSEVTVFSCRTNLPPNTAFRGFGAPQGMFVIESAIALAAEKLNVSAWMIQEKNLLRENDRFQYGQAATEVNIGSCWNTAHRMFETEKIEKEIEYFNKSNILIKKGMAFMPVCFGISFTNTPMNQARALVHIYQDGSVSISTGAVEMGQGVNTKLSQIAAAVFSVDISRIRIEHVNTTRTANTSPTAASSGADLNGNALLSACLALLDRLKTAAGEVLGYNPVDIQITNEKVLASGRKTDLTWEKLIDAAFLKRICLTENGHYATPFIHFDKKNEKGHPFAYHVYGTAIVTATVDCLRGTGSIDDVLIVHDFGNSLNQTIDTGQVEGAVVMGIGWMTMEEILFDVKGRLLSNSLSNYKVPDIYSVPKTIQCHALETEGPRLAILKSKAVGEPPFMYGIGAFFAIRNAIKAFNHKSTISFEAPLTPEKILMNLYSS
jgi:xanthine dehydrogenase large subunit